MKRTFFAVDIIPNAKLDSVLQDARNQLKGEKIKWSLPGQLHITLKFLGDTPENMLQGIIDAISEPLAGMQAINLSLDSVGLFKNLHDPRIIWIGTEPCPPLQHAAGLLNERLLPLGYAAEEREFLPHLTIGRVKEIRQKEKLGSLLEHYRHQSFGTVSINGIIFYESILKPEGPVYLPLKRFMLQ